MAAISIAPAAFGWVVVVAASVVSLAGSTSYLARQAEAIAAAGMVRAAPSASISIAAIAPLQPGSISAITPIPGQRITTPPATTPAPDAPSAETVAPRVLPVEQRQMMTVTIDGLNVRTHPSSKGRRLGAVRGGEQVAILGEQSGWVRIETPGLSGWVYREYLVASE